MPEYHACVPLGGTPTLIVFVTAGRFAMTNFACFVDASVGPSLISLLPLVNGSTTVGVAQPSCHLSHASKSTGRLPIPFVLSPPYEPDDMIVQKPDDASPPYVRSYSSGRP